MSYQPPAHGWRTFLIVWMTQSVSVFGSALTIFALNIWLAQTLYPLPEQKPELAFAISVLALSTTIPIVFGAPLAGVWADRHDRKRTMFVADIASGIVSLLLAALLASGALQLWSLLIFSFGLATLTAYHSAAFDTSYAMLVPAERLPRANGMMQTIWSLSGILSPAFAAGLIALPALARQGVLSGSVGNYLAGLRDGVSLALAVDALTFFFAASVLPFLHIPSPQRTASAAANPARPSFWADVREGILYIWRRKPMLWLLGTFAVANFTSEPALVLQPLLVKFNLAADWAARGFTFETALALISSVLSIGGVVGGLFISTWGGLKTRRVYGVLLPMIIGGMVQVLLGWSSWLYLSAALYALMSAMLPLMNAHSQTIWQTKTPHELQGRVFSVRRLIAQFTWPLGTFVAGISGGLFDPGIFIALMGAILTLFCTIQLFNPYLLRIEDQIG